MKTRLSIKSTLAAGLIATAAMTAFTFMAPLMGFEMDIPKMLAGTMGTHIIFGWIGHFIVGLVLAVIYATIFLTVIRKKANFKNGALFGILPWLLSQLMVMPMMGLLNGSGFIAGLFSGSAFLALGSLVGHIVYGAILGWLYKA